MELLLLLGLAVAQSSSAAQVPATRPPVQIGAFAYGTDGAVVATAVSTDLNGSARVYTNERNCRVGVGPIGSPQDATDVWHLSGRIVSITPDEVVAQLQWRRVLVGGQPSTTPEGVLQLTLRPGDRVLLDSVVPANGACWSSVGFEARYGASPFPSSDVARGAPQLRGTRDGGAGVAAALYDADVWFVRSVPGQPDTSRHVRYRIGADGAQFTLPPVSVDTPSGAAAVAVSGSLSIVNAPEGETRLRVAMRRTVTPAAGASFSRGFSTSARELPLPGREDILSFEMPGLKIGGAELPDRLSLRVRMTRVN